MCSPDVVRSALAGSAINPVQDLAPTVRFAAGGAPFRRVADLTHTITSSFPVFPFYKPYQARPLAAVEREGFCANELCFAEHTGTHLDAPAHFVAGGATTEALEVSRFVAPLVVVSVAERAVRDHDTFLTVDDLAAWERRHGPIPAGAVVAVHSGWEERLHEPGRFLNTDALGVMHHPGIGGEAAEWLVNEREIAGAAVDTLSLDLGASTTYEAHRILLGAGKYGLENVANLAGVPAAGATLVVGAPKHEGGSGGPARLLAFF